MSRRQVHEALILAAGRGERLAGQGLPKPLVSFMGMPLLLRCMKILQRAGVQRVVIVVGHASGLVGAAARRYADEAGLRLTVIRAGEWRHGNGASALTARHCFTSSFLMVMCDHLFEPAMLARLARARPPADGVLLAVDRQRENPLVDMADVTRVRCRGRRIIDIGKGLPAFDGFDTGAFHCTPALFDALAGSGGSISDAVRLLAEDGKARAWDVGDCFWADLDDAAAMARARRAMLVQAAGKAHDGPVARLFNRPVSLRLSAHLLNLGVTPMQVTWFSFLLAVLAALLIAQPAWAMLALGGVLAQAASIVDGCDGEIARLSMQESDIGAWLDAVLDRYADALLIAGFAVHAFSHEVQPLQVLLAGMAALSGTLINSYTADKYDGWMKRQGRPYRFRLGRDVRMLTMMMAAVADAPMLLLWGLAILMHMENARRIRVILR